MTARRPVILLGAQRSGTTALAHVLSAAFAATGGLFTVNGKLPYVLHRWCNQADVAGRHLRADEMIHALRRRPPYGDTAGAWLARVEQVLRNAAHEVAHGQWSEALALRRAIVRDSYASATRFGDKYNEYLLALDQLVETMPDAHLVVLFREPAAVAESVLRWSGDRPWLPRDLPAAYDKWVAWHRPLLSHPLSRDPSRCTVVEYRSVCTGPDLRRLAETIGAELLPFAALLRASGSRSVGDTVPDRVRQTYDALMDLRATSSRR